MPPLFLKLNIKFLDLCEMLFMQIGSFEITYVGLWVFVTSKDMGITLQWDKKTTVMVRLDPEHKGKVEGNLLFLSAFPD